jgi:hypothetical protein
VLTLQALGAFFHAATRKRIVPGHEAAAQTRDLLAIFGTAAADAEAFRAAVEGATQGKHSFLGWAPDRDRGSGRMRLPA